MKNINRDKKYVENIVIGGDNYRPYKYCVHVFEADVKGAVMVQSNNVTVMKNIVAVLVEKYGEKVCEKQSLYLIKIFHDFNGEFIREMNLMVDKVIRKYSDDTTPIFKMYEKRGYE